MMTGGWSSPGARVRVRTESAGTFTLPIETRRSVTFLVTAKGFAPQVVIERIAPGQSREMLILLDTAGKVGNRMLQSQEDRGERLRWRGNDAGGVGVRELRASGALSLADALLASPSATEKGLVFDESSVTDPSDVTASQSPADIERDDVFERDVLAAVAARFYRPAVPR